MITKQTAREIYNCYQQIEEIKKIKSEMVAEVERVRAQPEREEPIPESSFGRFGKGMQLGVPNDLSSSMRIFNIPPETAILVMEKQEKTLANKLKELETICKLEMR